MKDEKVSIIIPVYNGEKYIKEAIDSALNQTYKNIEVIVVNDGSKDSTDEICKSYGDKIRYFKKKNGGVSTALNYAISIMDGTYFSWLSHDDLYLPNKIEVEMKNMKTLDNKSIIFANYQLMNEYGKDFSKPEILEHEELIKKPIYSILHGYIGGITLLIPKKAFNDCGEFDPKLRCTQDYDMWYRMYKKGYKFVHITDIVSKTRIHQGQDTNNSPTMVSEGVEFYKKILNDITDKEKIKLDGSLYNFYYNQAKFLLTTPYEEVKNYCIEKCIELDKDRYNTNPIKKEQTGISYYINYLKDHGIKYTVKKIIKKIFK